MDISRRHLLVRVPLVAGSTALGGNSAMASPPISPARVRATFAFYVDAVNGVDGSNNGQSPATAFRTIDYASTYIRENVDTSGQAISINLLDGTHQVGAGANILYALVGAGQVAVTGNPANPNAVVVNCDAGGNCFSVQEPATCTISNLKMATSGANSIGVFARQFATCDLQNVVFGDFPAGIHAKAEDLASINMLAPGYMIAGGAAMHLVATNGSKVTLSTVGVSIPNPVAFNYFGYAADGGMIVGGGTTFTGSGVPGVTGIEYSCGEGSIIRKGGVTWPSNGKGLIVPGGSVDDARGRSEENTWTPQDVSGAGLTYPAWGSTTYIKQQKLITAFFYVQFPSNSDPTFVHVGGIPYPCKGGIQVGGGVISYFTGGYPISALMVGNAGAFNLVRPDGSFLTNADMSGQQIRGFVTYSMA